MSPVRSAYIAAKRPITNRVLVVIIAFIVTAFFVFMFIQASTQKKYVKELTYFFHQPHIDRLIQALSNNDKKDRLKRFKREAPVALNHRPEHIGYIALYDNKSQIIFEQATADLNIPSDILKRIKLNKDNYYTLNSLLNKHDYFIFPYRHFTDHSFDGGFVYVVELDHNTLIDSSVFIEHMIIVALVLLILADIVYITLKRTILRPLNSTTNQILDAVDGIRTSIEIDTNSNEFTQLKRTFNMLLQEMNNRDEVLMQTNEQLREESARLALLQETTVSANLANTSEAALANTIRNICHYTHWDIGHVLMYDQFSNEITNTDIWYFSDEQKFMPFKEATAKIDFNSKNGLAAEVIKSQRAIWVEDINSTQRYPRHECCKDLGINSCAGFPIVTQTGIWAVVEFFTRDKRKREEEFIDLIDNMSAQLNRVIERKNSEEKLKIATEEAEKAQQTAELANHAKTEFLANMSHELRTPLHGILSYTSLGIKKINDNKPEKLLEYFETIKKSGYRLLNLLDDLLDLSKLEARKVEFEFVPNRLHEMTEHVLKELESVINDKNIVIEQHFDTFDELVELDNGKITQVIINLLSNAIKFTPEGHTIVIMAKHDKLPPIKDGDPSVIPAVSYHVIDEGVGIPPKELDDVFNKFIQSSKTKTGAGGTGLGLSICREIISAHCGKIKAANNDQVGATFTFTIPVNQLNHYATATTSTPDSSS